MTKKKSIMDKWKEWDKKEIKALKSKKKLTIFEAARLSILQESHRSSFDNSSWATPNNW